MKRSLFSVVLMTVVMLVTSALLFSSCTKEGPEGPQGPIGGDGSVICGNCHNIGTDLYAKIMQYEASTHYTGGNFDRNGTSCAPCHTHEGFMEVLETGAMATAAAISNPTPVNCRTCHKIHTTFTQADYELTTTKKVTLWLNGQSIDLGQGNLCTNCHQPRIPNPNVTLGGGGITITSSTWGVHYGAQTAVMAGTGGYELTGSMSYNVPAKHGNAVQDGCVSCHMASAVGNKAGGHTFAMRNGTTPNMAGCTGCHAGATNFDIGGVQTEITGLINDLKTLLVAKGILNGTTDRAIPGTYSEQLAGCLLNYKLVYGDHSYGVHNYGYSKALLVNSIEWLTAN